MGGGGGAECKVREAAGLDFSNETSFPVLAHRLELFLFNILPNKICSFFSSFGFDHFLGYVDTIPDSVFSDTKSYLVHYLYLAHAR